MTTDSINELVKRLREEADHQHNLAHDCDCAPEVTANWVAMLNIRSAADALEALEAEVEGLKHNVEQTSAMYHEVAAERDRLKAALEALEAVRSDLPEKVSEQWLYEGVRHWHRNCDWDEPRDGSPLDRGDGATVAKILNMIPRKALGGDAS